MIFQILSYKSIIKQTGSTLKQGKIETNQQERVVYFFCYDCKRHDRFMQDIALQNFILLQLISGNWGVFGDFARTFATFGPVLINFKKDRENKPRHF